LAARLADLSGRQKWATSWDLENVFKPGVLVR